MSEKIKNCPCCGGAAEIIIDNDENFRIKCRRCGLMTETCHYNEEIVKKSIITDWNRRREEEARLEERLRVGTCNCQTPLYKAAPDGYEYAETTAGVLRLILETHKLPEEAAKYLQERIERAESYMQKVRGE